MRRYLATALSLAALALGPAPFLCAEPGHKFAPLTDLESAMIGAALPAKPAEAPAKARKLLVFHRTEGFVHDSIPIANETLRRIGEATGAFTTTTTEDMSAFEPAKLAAYDAVAFVSTTELKFENPVHRKALLDFVESGKGVVGIHAATDNFPTWPEGQALIGGCFHSHPWFSNQVVAVKLDEPDHILNAGFEKRGFRIREEIYRMKGPYSRQRQRVIVSLDMSKKENERPKAGITGTDGDFGISWIRTAGKGRVFYTSLGHNKDIFFVPAIQRHFLDGIRFALGDLAADAVPSVALPTKPTPALAPDSGPTLQDLAREKFAAEKPAAAKITASGTRK